MNTKILPAENAGIIPSILLRNFENINCKGNCVHDIFEEAHVLIAYIFTHVLRWHV